MRLLGISDEELRSIRIGAIVRHGQDSPVSVLQIFPQFIIEFFAPNALTAFSSISWISCLDHEPFDISMEDAAIIITRSAQSQKILQNDLLKGQK